jgi:hypothetical protein
MPRLASKCINSAEVLHIGSRPRSAQLVAYYLLSENRFRTRSDLDVWNDTDPLRVNPEGKHRLGGKLDDDAGKVARKTAPRETIDGDVHQDTEDNDQDTEGEFNVEVIHGHRFVRGKLYYEIK